MYLPRHHEETDLAVLHALIEAHPLGAWVTQDEHGGPVADHVPFLLDRDRGALGTLVAHVARANPAWRSFSRSVESLVVFQGAQCYVTPSWYPGRHADPRVVPTWNYAVVHVRGMPHVVDDRDWLRRHVERLTDTHEARHEAPWRVADAPADFIDTLLGAIVGIEIPVSRIVGKWKTSQNRAPADRRGVVEGLLGEGGADTAEMAAMVGRHVPPLEGG